MRNKIYTKTGDSGETSIIGGDRVSKANPRLDAYGTTDELNAGLGLALSEMEHEAWFHELSQTLTAVQNQLFAVGSQLACEDASMRSKLPNVNRANIQTLEQQIDKMDASLPELKEFILPGGSKVASALHLSRTVCRRAERNVVALADPANALIVEYLNRLGDFLFVAARYANHVSGTNEVKWQK